MKSGSKTLNLSLENEFDVEKTKYLFKCDESTLNTF